MAVKSSQILHDAQGFVIDRLQSAGVGSVNIPEEKIYELGNFQAVATVRDIPDLSFDMESFDVSTEIEALLTGVDPTTIVDGDEFDFNDTKPLDVISPFKSAINQYDIVKGIAVPHLTLERAAYRFGVGQNSTQSYTLRGDSIYYIPGSPYAQVFTNIGTGAYAFDETAILYTEQGSNVYALNICLKDSTSNKYKRLVLGTDYTNTSAGFTLLNDESATYDEIHVVYGSTTAATYNQTVHQNASVKPAAVRGKDIDVYIGTSSATPVFSRWTGVQSFEVNRNVNLDNDQEFGNYHYVSQDYDVAEVTGSITVRPRDVEDLFDKIQQVSDVNSNEIVGPHSSIPLPLELRVSSPDTGDVVKTLYIPDARFTIPGYSPRVQQKLEVQFDFASDGGVLKVYAGER